MEYTRRELFARFEQLPEDIQDAFLSVDTYNTIKEISDKYKLHIDQSGKLSEQIGYLMLGLLRPEDFLSSIAKEVGLSIETAGEITKEVNARIFFPIRTQLEKINAGGDPYRNDLAPKIEHFSPAGNVSENNIEKHDEPLPNPDNNAIIVNKAVPEKDKSESKDAGQKIFDEKMSKLFRIPKEEVDLGGSPVAPKVADPYRETVG